jgi:hypothetical protein
MKYPWWLQGLSLTTTQNDEPVVEYEDEFGRMRTAKRSEVPRAMLQKLESDLPKDDE